MRFWKRFLLEERSHPVRYAVAALLAFVFLALVYLVSTLEGTRLTSLAIVSVVLSAIFGGVGPALLAAAISAVGMDYFFDESAERLFDSWTSVLRVMTYATVGAIVASIVASLRDAYRDLHVQYLRAEEAKRARESVVGIVSHDLRTPLSAILLGIGYVKDAAREGAAPAAMEDALDAIHRSAASMKRLVDDLLDEASVQAGRFRIEPARQNLDPILEDAVAAGRLAARARHIAIDLDVPPGEHVLVCDRQRLTQVLANLIGNAVKFSPEGSRVQVRLEPGETWLQIEVKDFGPGIRAEDLPHVFSRYWQAADTARLGTGLGLYIAKTILEAHGGRIEASSEPGRGATFRVYLQRTS